MATYLTERYTQLYPDKVVNRYCEQDPFENLTEADIIVTTVISAGTAVDIPNLRVVVQTVCISSSVANIQTLGRLRKLVGKDTRFCYLYAENLNKQRQYHQRRLELYSARVANHKCLRAR
jgi:superfamily II DNA or RNA helicase